MLKRKIVGIWKRNNGVTRKRWVGMLWQRDIGGDNVEGGLGPDSFFVVW